MLHTCCDKTALVQELKPGQNFSNLFPPVHTCSHPFTPVHNCSHLTDYPRSAQWQLLIECFPCESCYFSILCAIFLKLHIFAHLIESYPTVYGLSSCVEKNIDPSGSPYYNDHVRSSDNIIFCSFEYSYSSVLHCILLKLPNFSLAKAVIL